jgi:hypothetical protein
VPAEALEETANVATEEPDPVMDAALKLTVTPLG